VIGLVLERKSQTPRQARATREGSILFALQNCSIGGFYKRPEQKPRLYLPSLRRVLVSLRYALGYNKGAVMHRIITVALLSICLGVFLCPAVGRPAAISWAVEKPAVTSCSHHQSCPSDAGPRCEMTQNTDDCFTRSAPNSSSSHCCPAPCSTLVLIYSASDHQRVPEFAVRTLSAPDQSSLLRTERPPVPPPRV
jgi:hypothetical protein